MCDEMDKPISRTTRLYLFLVFFCTGINFNYFIQPLLSVRCPTLAIVGHCPPYRPNLKYSAAAKANPFGATQTTVKCSILTAGYRMKN